MHRRFRTLAVAVVAVAGLSCGDAVAPVGTSIDYLIDESIGIIDMRYVLSLGLGVGYPAGPTQVPYASGCTFKSDTKVFDCGTWTEGTATFSLFYQLLDAGGNPTSSTNGTQSVRIVLDDSVPPPAGFALPTYVSHHDRTITGLTSANHAMTGFGSTHIVFAGSSGLPGTDRTVVDTVKTVVFPDKMASYWYPLSGTWSAWDYNNVTSGLTIRHMTFDGTAFAAVAKTVNGATTQCSTDLIVPFSTTCP